MINRAILVTFALFLLSFQTRSSSLSLARSNEAKKALKKRSEVHWWTWSSEDGYKLGTGTPPSNYNNYPNFANIAPSLTIPSYSSFNGHQGSGKPQPSSNYPHVADQGMEKHLWLHFHNFYRAKYHARPLVWSERLVAASKRLTDTCVWKHTENNEFGENMSAGQTSIQEVVDGWVKGPDERNIFEGPDSELTHFTQVVWESSTELGCYRTTCQDVEGANLPQSPVIFWACNYNPPGNVIGQTAQNVKAAPGGQPL